MPELGNTRNGEALTDDALAGDFRIWQRKRGHRYSLDDVATAFVALQACVDHGLAVEHALDLGTGIGSVLLMLAYKLPNARLCGVEAQEVSFALLQRNVARNGARPRTVLAHADFRTPGLLSQLAARSGCADGFQLVTGTPPYQPVGHGPISPDSQRAHARVELRGGVEAYVAACAQVLHPTGRAIVCADARRPERVHDSAREAGLSVLERTDVVPIAEHKGALFSVYVLGRAYHAGQRVTQQVVRKPDLVARDRDGGRSAQAVALRRFFDLPVDEHEAQSPRTRQRSQRAG